MKKEVLYLSDFYEISNLLDDDLLTDFLNALYTSKHYPSDYNLMKMDEAFHNLWIDFEKNDENVLGMEKMERWKLVYRVAITLDEIHNKNTQDKYIISVDETYKQITLK